MADKISMLARFGGRREWEILADEENPKDPLTIAKQIRSEAQHLLTAFSEDVQAVRQDPDFTDEGKQRRVVGVATQALSNIDKLKEKAPAVEYALSDAVRRAGEREAPEDRIASLLEQAEIRRYLSEALGNDAVQVRIAYMDALEADDFATLDAIENSPRLWPGRPNDETLAELKSRRLNKVDPRLGEEVNLLNDAVSDITDCLADVEKEIRTSGGFPGDDPIAKLATGA